MILSWAALVVLLAVVGFVLLVLEILIIPGFGVPGILGIGAILGAGVLAWIKLGAVYGLLALGLGLVCALALFWIFPKTSAGRAMILSDAQNGSAADPSLAALVGREGRTLTPLHPAGTAEIADKPVDVVTDGLYVEAGTWVRVVLVEGVRVVVEPVAESQPQEKTS